MKCSYIVYDTAIGDRCEMCVLDVCSYREPSEPGDSSYTHRVRRFDLETKAYMRIEEPNIIDGIACVDCARHLGWLDMVDAA